MLCNCEGTEQLRRFLSDGGESGAQADRIFLLLHSARYADHAVYREHGVSCDHRRRASFNRISAVLLLSMSECKKVQKKKLSESASF